MAALTLDVTGSFVYTPLSSFTGTDTFTYQASNGTTSSNVATVTITVTAILKTTPTVTVSDAGGTYTGAAFPATAKAERPGRSGRRDADAGVLHGQQCERHAAHERAPTTVGTYTVLATFAGSTDYTNATSFKRTFTITQATPAADVVATPTAITYGTSL